MKLTEQETRTVDFLEKQANRAKFLLDRYVWDLRDKYGIPDEPGPLAQRLLTTELEEK